jgi:hypothetical protein
MIIEKDNPDNFTLDDKRDNKYGTDPKLPHMVSIHSFIVEDIIDSYRLFSFDSKNRVWVFLIIHFLSNHAVRGTMHIMDYQNIIISKRNGNHFAFYCFGCF